mmetsp:Transcript_776/g.1153  ORF Transcript_776/g.1153 Transcript_776/m.1153 type:complete len:537 (+) Transcript_776:122-1732(+)
MGFSSFIEQQQNLLIEQTKKVLLFRQEEDFDSEGTSIQDVTFVSCGWGCLIVQIILLVILLALAGGMFFLLNHRRKILFASTFIFGPLINFICLCAISWAIDEKETLVWPWGVWVFVSYFLSLLHVAFFLPLNELLFHLPTVVLGVVVLIFVPVQGVGEWDLFVLHVHFLPALFFLGVYFVGMRSKTTGEENEGVSEVSGAMIGKFTYSEAITLGALAFGYLGPILALGAFAINSNSDLFSVKYVIVWLSFSLLFMFVIPIAVAVFLPNLRTTAIGVLFVSLISIAVFSVLFFAGPDLAVVFLLFYIFFFVILLTYYSVIPSKTVGLLKILLAIVSFYAPLGLVLGTFCVSEVIGKSFNYTAWLILFIWSTIISFSIPVFQYVWISKVKSQGPTGGWGEDATGEAPPPADQLSGTDKFLLIIPTLILLVFGIPLALFSLAFGDSDSFVGGLFLCYVGLFLIPFFTETLPGFLSPHLSSSLVVEGGRFFYGVLGLVLGILGLVAGIDNLAVLIVWLVTGSLLMLMALVIIIRGLCCQ